MTERADLARLLAALERSDAARWREGGGGGATPATTKRKVGRPPALTPAQVEAIRRRRRLPLTRRPRITELAAEFQVDRWTIRKALQARPPYDFGEPVPSRGGRHRDRGSGRF